MLRKFTATIALVGAVAAAAACAPIEVGMDNPLTGAQATLAEGQALTVRMSNVKPEDGEWRLVTNELNSLSFEGRDVRPPANGVRQLETFNFTGAAAGTEEVTLAYVQNADSRIMEEVTLNVAVR